MCEILTNPYTWTQRKRRAEVVRQKAMLWLATKARPAYRPNGGDDGERGPSVWFSVWMLGQACGCDSRSDWQTLGRLLEKMVRCGSRGRMPVTGLLERRYVEGVAEYRRTW